MKYAFSINDYSAIIDSNRDYRNGEISALKNKLTYERHFRVYHINERIASEMMDENSIWCPLHRRYDSSDNEFSSRDEALKCFEENIYSSIADEIYNL